MRNVELYNFFKPKSYKSSGIKNSNVNLHLNVDSRISKENLHHLFINV